MKIAPPPEQYDPGYERQRNAAIEQALRASLKKGTDIELGPGERLIVRAPDGARWSVEVENNGNVTTSAL